MEKAERTLNRLEEAGISLNAVTDQVLREGVQKFAEPFDKLIQAIEAKRAAVAGSAGDGRPHPPGAQAPSLRRSAHLP